ncbi:hypothetical protein D3C72_1935950 [compost metagenome]
MLGRQVLDRLASDQPVLDRQVLGRQVLDQPVLDRQVSGPLVLDQQDRDQPVSGRPDRGQQVWRLWSNAGTRLGCCYRQGWRGAGCIHKGRP